MLKQRSSVKSNVVDVNVETVYDARCSHNAVLICSSPVKIIQDQSFKVPVNEVQDQSFLPTHSEVKVDSESDHDQSLKSTQKEIAITEDLNFQSFLVSAFQPVMSTIYFQFVLLSIH